MKNEKREKIEYRQATAICGNTPPNLNSTLSSMARIGGGAELGDHMAVSPSLSGGGGGAP